MKKIIVKKINRSEEKEVLALIDTVIGRLERPEFFIPFETWELESLFDEKYAYLFGAYLDEKLVGMCQIYIQPDFINDIVCELNLEDFKVAELGGYLVLPSYRGNGIMKHLGEFQLQFLRDNTNIEYAVAVVHPENLPSKKSLLAIGLKYVKTGILSQKHFREYYQLNIRQ